MNRKLAALGAACVLACAPAISLAQGMPQTYTDVLGTPHTVVPTWNVGGVSSGGGGGSIGTLTMPDVVAGVNGTSGASSSNPLPTSSRYDQQTILLAGASGSPATLAAGASSTPVTVTISATYGYSYIISGTSPSVALQTLGPDGSTYQTAVTVAATGAQGIVIFAGATGATVRLLNTGANSVTITAKLAS